MKLCVRRYKKLLMMLIVVSVFVGIFSVVVVLWIDFSMGFFFWIVCKSKIIVNF